MERKQRLIYSKLLFMISLVFDALTESNITTNDRKLSPLNIDSGNCGRKRDSPSLNL